MTIKLRNAGKVRILEPHGRMVLREEPVGLHEAVKRIVAEGCEHIVIDLSHVPYLDSHGTGEHLACKNHALGKGAEIRLVIPPSSAIPLHTQTCLRLAFDTFEDEVKAVGSFAR